MPFTPSLIYEILTLSRCDIHFIDLLVKKAKSKIRLKIDNRIKK